MFSGYKATLFRDLPFSALQFAFYEKEQSLARDWTGRKEIGLPLEILTGASAGGLAGIITCPMDVVKTRIQTQLDPALTPTKAPPSRPASSKAGSSEKSRTTSLPRPSASTPTKATSSAHALRQISTSGASTSLKQHGQVTLDTESVVQGLRVIYRAEGFAGWFRGVGPRAVWTSIQSGTMLVVYQSLLKHFDMNPLFATEDD